jgi:hypothetical protein
MFYHNIASDLSDQTFPPMPPMRAGSRVSSQLIEIHRELLEDYSGVWKGFRVEL